MKHTPVTYFEIPVPVIKKKSLHFADFFLCDNGVLVVQLDDELSFDEPKAIEFMEMVKIINKQKPLKMVMIAGESTTSDDLARKYFASSEHLEQISRLAIVIGNAAQQLIGNFFLQINKPAIPSKLFKKPQEAWDWIVK